MEANVNMSPPWGHRRALFPTDDTGLHLVGFLLKWDKEDQYISLRQSLKMFQIIIFTFEIYLIHLM